MSTDTAASQVTQASTPVPLRVAAVGLLAEGIGLLIATGFSAAATISGTSYHANSGIALTLLALAGAVAAAILAYAIAKTKPWSRTPTLLIQVFVVIGGIMTVQGHRLDWGIPLLVLAAVTVAGLLAPASLKALNRTM